MPSFDGTNLIITLDSGVATVDVETDLYSDWKEWFKTGTNARFATAFRTFGGDPLSASVEAGAYFMFQNQNGWRIRPPEEDITIQINGNIAPEDPNLPIAIPTIGAFTALLLGIQPITQNVDAIIEEQEIKVTNLQYQVESLREDHSAFGESWYLNPVSGLDTNDGITPATAFKTFSAVHTAANESDVINLVPEVGQPFTALNERLNITKNFLHIRGPGSIFHIHPLIGDTGNIIDITGDGVSVSGVTIKTDALSGNGVNVAADTVLIEDVFIDGVPGNCFCDQDGTGNILRRAVLDNAGDQGILAIHSTRLTIENCGIHTSTNEAIRIEGNINGDSAETDIRNTVIKDVSTGISIASGSSGTKIRDNNRFVGTVPVKILDAGTATHNEIQFNIAAMNQDVIRTIESQRGRHTGTGNIYYWDPINGNDAWDGLTIETAKLTWAGANALVVAYNHDIVMIQPGEVSGITTITEQITIDKEYTFLRGPGRDVRFKPSNTTNGTIQVDAEGAELSGVRIETADTGDGDALIVNGNFCMVHNVWIEHSQNDGIRLQNVSYAEIKDCLIRNCANDGVAFRGITQDSKYNIVHNTNILFNGGHGLYFTGTNCQNNLVWGGDKGVFVAYNTGWGIFEDDSANFNHAIGPTVSIHDNTAGKISFSGSSSEYENIGSISSNVWEEITAGHTTVGTYGGDWIDIKANIVRMLGYANENTAWSNMTWDTSTTPPRILSGKITVFTDDTLGTPLTDGLGNVALQLDQEYEADGSTKTLTCKRVFA